MSELVNCRWCWKGLDHKAKKCSHCGAVIGKSKSRVVAIVLALYLGGFGVHKFYLGRKGQGMLYLLFFWTLIPQFIAVCECIKYLFTPNDEFAKKYG